MKIIKIKSWDDNFCGSRKDEEALLKEHGCRWLTPDEFADYCDGKEFNDYLPCHLMTPRGSVRRGLGLIYGRDVGVGGRFDDRRGVLGTPTIPIIPHKHNWKTKKYCECGEEAKE